VKVFISWSGTKGQKVADALHPWLRRVLQFVEPLVSTRIEKGAQWNAVLARQLDESRAGIVCVTQESLNSRWLHYEAGALSKVVEGEGGDERGKTAVLTYLVDVAPTDVEYPLAQFQHTLAIREDTLELVLSINRIGMKYGASTLSAEDVREIFTQWWPKLEAKLKEIAEEPELEQAPMPVARKERELLEELLELVRGLYRREEATQSLVTIAMLDREREALAQSAVMTLDNSSEFYIASVQVNGGNEQIDAFINAVEVQIPGARPISNRISKGGARFIRFGRPKPIPLPELEMIARQLNLRVTRALPSEL
jgi:hypothetical protein